MTNTSTFPIFLIFGISFVYFFESPKFLSWNCFFHIQFALTIYCDSLELTLYLHLVPSQSYLLCLKFRNQTFSTFSYFIFISYACQDPINSSSLMVVISRASSMTTTLASNLLNSDMRDLQTNFSYEYSLLVLRLDLLCPLI